MTDTRPEQDHFAYQLATELDLLGLIQPQSYTEDGSPYFGLFDPIDRGTALALCAVMVNYQDNVLQVMAKLKKAKKAKGNK